MARQVLGLQSLGRMTFSGKDTSASMNRSAVGLCLQNTLGWGLGHISWRRWELPGKRLSYWKNESGWKDWRVIVWDPESRCE